MAAAIVLAFLVGAAVGFVLGRRNPVAAPPGAAAAAGGAVPRRPKGKKAILAEAPLVPQDDILERLRKVADGELDPRELEVQRAPAPTAEELTAEAERRAREERVLDRLRRQAQASDLANERDSGESR